MKRLLCILSVLGLALATPAFADTLTLDNGDRLTGTVTGDEDGKVVIDVDGVGEVRIDAARVTDRVIEEPVAAEDLDTTIEVLADEVEEEKSPWTIGLDLGAYYTAGNTETRGVNLGASAKREDVDTIFLAFATYRYAENDEIRNSNETIVGVRHDWKFDDETWFIYTGANAERDEFEKLDLRAQFFVGAGVYLEKSDDLTIRLETAPAATYIDYRDPDAGDPPNEQDEEWIAEWIFSFFGEWKMTESLTGRQWIRWMPNLTHHPNYRSNWITELETPVAKNVAAKLSFFWDRNTNPAPDTEKDDYKVLLSIVWRF